MINEEFYIKNDKKYKIKTIYNSNIYIQKIIKKSLILYYNIFKRLIKKQI